MSEVLGGFSVKSPVEESAKIGVAKSEYGEESTAPSSSSSIKAPTVTMLSSIDPTHIRRERDRQLRKESNIFPSFPRLESLTDKYKCEGKNLSEPHSRPWYALKCLIDDFAKAYEASLPWAWEEADQRQPRKEKAKERKISEERCHYNDLEAIRKLHPHS